MTIGPYEHTGAYRADAQAPTQERRDGMGSPVPARGRLTGGRQQPGELVPVAPITGEGAAVRTTAGTAAPPTDELGPYCGCEGWEEENSDGPYCGDCGHHSNDHIDGPCDYDPEDES